MITADLDLQKRITERLLLSSLNEADAADRAASSLMEALLGREEAELATSNQLRFLANISHELRTPLNAMMGYVALIEDQIHGPITPSQRDDLERIRLNQVRLLSLANELLAFSRSGTQRPNQRIELPVLEAVARAAALLDNTLARKNIHYHCQCDDSSLTARADPARVEQILLNLIANAAKFTAPGGSITTKCEAVGTQVRISVTDDGIGIAPNHLSVIFEAFVQVEPNAPENGGVGLGLAISRDLARAMDGDLTVESQVGVGTCFTLSLPRDAAPWQQAGAE